jgi:hypothetical protein
MGASDAVADKGVKQRQDKKAQAGCQEHSIEHGTLRNIPVGVIPERIGIRYGTAAAIIRIS